MPARTATLGPWPRGVNLTSNRDLSVFLSNDELGEAVNVSLTPEGFVVPRPGVKVIWGDLLYMFGGTFKILGSVKLPDSSTVAFVQVTYGDQSVVYKVLDATTLSMYFIPPVGTHFNHVLMHTGITGHTGIIFFASEVSKSYVTTDYTLGTTPTLIASAIPASDEGIIVKNRLFLVSYSESKFMWSPAVYIFDWTGTPGGPNGDDISGYELIDPTTSADGITAVEFTNNSFYIFKKYKTYLFTYQATPAEDGYLRKISDVFGALSSTLYRGNVIVLNHKGVYRIESTEFIDLQSNLNLAYELPLGNSDISVDDTFLTVFNDDVIIGFRDVNTALDSPDMLWADTWSDTWEDYTYGPPSSYYFCLNGYTGGWTQWTFGYNEGEALAIASLGNKLYKAQKAGTSEQILLSTTFDKTKVVYIDAKPSNAEGKSTYHLDSNVDTEITVRHEKYYIPPVTVKTKAAIGSSMLRFKKIYRTFIRFYLSDYLRTQITDPADALWKFSINYNEYKFSTDTSNDGNPLLYLYPRMYDPDNPVVSAAEGTSDIYRRTYQLPIGQQRAEEFVFELSRAWSTVTDPIFNPDTDRDIKSGYYFALSGIMFDYADREQI